MNHKNASLGMKLASIFIVLPLLAWASTGPSTGEERKFVFPQNLEEVKKIDGSVYHELQKACEPLIVQPSKVEHNIINTAIIQYSPIHANSSDPIIQKQLSGFRNCHKFQESYRVCCQAICDFYQDPRTREAVMPLTKGIEDLITKAADRQRGRKQLQENQVVCQNQERQETQETPVGQQVHTFLQAIQAIITYFFK